MATTAKLHRDDDADGGDNVDSDGDVKHVDEHADESHLPIDEDDDSRFTLRDGAIDNAMTIALTMNGDNHFPREQRTTYGCRAKEVHILETNEASSFST